MELQKIKKKLDKIFKVVMNYELEKWQREKEIKVSTKSIKKLTEDIKNTPIT